MKAYPVCVAVRAGEVVIVPTGARRLFAGVAYGAHELIRLFEILSASGRPVSLWEVKLQRELLQACPEAEVAVSKCMLTIRPGSGGEAGLLADTVAAEVRRLLIEDEWRIVSQSCADMGAAAP